MPADLANPVHHHTYIHTNIKHAPSYISNTSPITLLTCFRNPANAMLSIQHRGKILLAVIFVSSYCCFLPSNTMKAMHKSRNNEWLPRIHGSRALITVGSTVLISLWFSDSKKRPAWQKNKWGADRTCQQNAPRKATWRNVHWECAILWCIFAWSKMKTRGEEGAQSPKGKQNAHRKADWRNGHWWHAILLRQVRAA